MLLWNLEEGWEHLCERASVVYDMTFIHVFLDSLIAFHFFRSTCGNPQWDRYMHATPCTVVTLIKCLSGSCNTIYLHQAL